MDILRKELNEIYKVQRLSEEKLDAESLTEFGSSWHYLGLDKPSLLSQVLDPSLIHRKSLQIVVYRQAKINTSDSRK